MADAAETLASSPSAVRTLHQPRISAVQVAIREVGPRDGFQNEPEVVSTDDKVRLIELLAATGLLLNVARGGTAAAPARRGAGAARLRAIDGGRAARRPTAAERSASRIAKSRHSRGRNRGTRRAGTGRRRRATG